MINTKLISLYETIIKLPDSAIGQLYSQWSETYYAAGWMSGGEVDFVNWLKWLTDEKNTNRGSQDYEVKTISKIRDLIKNEIKDEYSILEDSPLLEEDIF